MSPNVDRMQIKGPGLEFIEQENRNPKLKIELPRGAKEISCAKALGIDRRGCIFNYVPQYKMDYAEGYIAQNMFVPTPLYYFYFYIPLMLFDQIELPCSSHVDFSEQNAMFLREAGHLRTVDIVACDFFDNSTIRRDPFDVYRLRSREDPGKWTLFSSIGDDPVPESESVPDAAFSLGLHNALPFPHFEAPLDDVLNFRERRRDELIALRREIESAAERVRHAGQNAHTARETFLKALYDYVAVMREPNWKKLVGSLQIEVNWLALAAGAVAFEAKSYLTAAAALAGSFVSIKSVRGVRNADTNPFAYIASIESEFGNR
jgi:Family of unknown function (DUF6236)